MTKKKMIVPVPPAGVQKADDLWRDSIRGDMTRNADATAATFGNTYIYFLLTEGVKTVRDLNNGSLMYNLGDHLADMLARRAWIGWLEHSRSKNKRNKVPVFYHQYHERQTYIYLSQPMTDLPKQPEWINRIVKRTAAEADRKNMWAEECIKWVDPRKNHAGIPMLKEVTLELDGDSTSYRDTKSKLVAEMIVLLDLLVTVTASAVMVDFTKLSAGVTAEIMTARAYDVPVLHVKTGVEPRLSIFCTAFIDRTINESDLMARHPVAEVARDPKANLPGTMTASMTIVNWIKNEISHALYSSVQPRIAARG